ncbi:heme-binding domain-containing protein [bacterium SCSIO 12643]|nr:heme-binding domain-containing protein [bacterium SCSIO 12643]
MKKRILLGLVILFLGMQLFRIDMENPTVNYEHDFISMMNPPAEVEAILRTSCYDCHSNETNYPWYSNVAPVSWWVEHHIEEGREELNFSEWGTYDAERKDHKLEECAEEVEEGEMPLQPYTITHGDAKLTDEQKELLEEWFNSVR